MDAKMWLILSCLKYEEWLLELCAALPRLRGARSFRRWIRCLIDNTENHYRPSPGEPMHNQVID
jgi:hypothetical protein